MADAVTTEIVKLDREEFLGNRKFLRRVIPIEHPNAMQQLSKKAMHNYEKDFEENQDFLELISNPILYKTLCSLKKQELQIIELRYKDQMAFKDIASKLSLSDNTASKIHQRSLSKIRKELKGDTTR